jgi:serpin B
MMKYVFRRVTSVGALLVWAVALLAHGCSGVTRSNDMINSNLALTNSNGAAQEARKKEAQMVDKRLVAANTDFGFRLYAEVTGRSGGKNVFVSPSSIGLALAMAYNGAEGETKQVIARGLALQGMGLEEVNRAYAQLKAALENPDPKVQLNIANSLWARKGMTFKPQFIKRNADFYGAEVSELDFDSPGAASAINNWVSGKTNGKIQKIVDQISQDSILFLINAIYFKGTWTAEFDKSKTKEDYFTTAAGARKKHPMMSQSGEYNYYKGDNFQAVSLPYGGGRVSMYVFLPDEGATLDAFHKSLNRASWDRWMSAFEETRGDIVMPRFKLEYEIELNDALKALGMGLAFDAGRADFSGMLQTANNAYINKVKHKTFVEVNEEGTEAAAVTSAEVQITSMRQPRDMFRMVVDRPFFCAIRDNETGTVLFMGAIVDPQ